MDNAVSVEQLEICRLCAGKCNLENSRHLFSFASKKLIRQIRDITGTLLKKSKGLPNQICDLCHKDLLKLDEFLNRFKNAQNYFSSVEYKKAKLKINKNETNTKNELNSNQILLENVEHEFSFIDDNINLIQTNVNDNDTLIKDYNVDTDESRLRNDTTTDNIIPVITVDLENTNKIEKATKRKTTQTTTTTTTKAKASIKPKEKVEKKNRTTICDQCGNHFKKHHHFLLHMKRHNNDRQFKCELCDHGFVTQAELNRHMRKHTGERPYPCRHCDRRFTDYSTRIKHERTHTNERPFVCTGCNKAFTTSYILKNHMLTHTGERPYSCKTCNKTFQRPSHLAVHYRAQIHFRNQQKTF